MKPTFVFLWTAFLCLATASPGLGKEFSRSQTFQEARSLALQGDRAQAMVLCREILEEDPGDRETKTLQPFQRIGEIKNRII